MWIYIFLFDFRETINISDIHSFSMKPRDEHKLNAALEKRWMNEAKEDANYLHSAAQREASMGHIVRARFDAEEARNAGSWIGKREKILVREERLAGGR